MYARMPSYNILHISRIYLHLISQIKVISIDFIDKMIDSHTHIYSVEFDSDRDDSILRAKEVGVSSCIMPNVDRDSFPKMIEVYRQHPDYCFPTFGLHPTSVEKNYQSELDWIYREAIGNISIFKAIGEIGIDCYWSLDYIQEQRDAFKQQINWALKLNLPIIIHAREAFYEIFSILDEKCTSELKGVFHSFTGTLDDYKRIKNYGGFKIGVGGVVTFKNSNLGQVVAKMELEDIVLETDAPYLAPHPYRGKRNESAYLNKVIDKIAQVKNMSANQVAEQTDINAKDLFGI